MSEKKLRDSLAELVDMLDRAGYVSTQEWLDGEERARKALAEAGEPEMVRLLLMLHALEGTNRGFAEYYEEQGHYIVAKQKTIRADTYLHIKDIIQDEFGYKLEAEE
jgi:hypothetical protein